MVIAGSYSRGTRQLCKESVSKIISVARSSYEFLWELMSSCENLEVLVSRYPTRTESFDKSYIFPLIAMVFVKLCQTKTRTFTNIILVTEKKYNSI